MVGGQKVVTVDDMNVCLISLLLIMPTLEEKVKEIQQVQDMLLWLRPLWIDSRRQSGALAKGIGMLTSLCHCLTEGLMEAPTWQPLYMYNDNAEAMSMFDKLNLLQLSEDQLGKKIQDLSETTKFLLEMSRCEGHASTVFHCCVVIMMDSWNHLLCYNRAMFCLEDTPVS